VSESAVSAKRGVGVSLARNRRSPKRPSEPRPSGVHPEEAKWKKLAKPYTSDLPVRQPYTTSESNPAFSSGNSCGNVCAIFPLKSS